MTSFPIDGFRDSLWNNTAVKSPDTRGGDEVSDASHYDAIIVGAGFTGLNAAIDMNAAGMKVCVLEAEHLGFGASGRAGGQVNMGMNSGPKELVKKFGAEQTERTIEMVRNTPSRVFERIARLGLNCDPVQNGWVQAAVNEKVAKEQRKLVGEYEAHGGGFDLLSKGQMLEKTGSSSYHSGMVCPSAGTLHPLSYTYELSRVAIEAGVEVYTQSKVTGLQKNQDSWSLEVNGEQTLKAGQVLLCTNGYTDDLLSGLKQKIVPIRSVLVATEPLSEELRAKILPNQLSFVDKRRLILYMRYDRHGRLCVGDHGPMRETFNKDDFVDVKKRAIEVFPELKNIRWDFHWGGRVAMTRDHLPFMHQPEQGLLTGMGYNGRGVGLGSLMGTMLAKVAVANQQGVQTPKLGLPMTNPKSYPFHAFHKLGVKIGLANAKFWDMWETK